MSREMPLLALFRRHAQPVALAALLGLLTTPLTHGADGTWNVDADGNWSTATNWVSSVIADGAGSTAILNRDITVARTITPATDAPAR